MLSVETVALYLLQCGLLDAQSIVEGKVMVVDSSRRNTNFKVICTPGPSYLVKQGFGPQRAASIANEAAAYQLLHREANRHRTLLRYTPVFRLYDPAEHILVLDLVPSSAHLGAYQHRTGRFSKHTAAEMGNALALVHSVEDASASGAGLHPCDPPWILSAHRATVALYRQMSNANIRLISLLQHATAAHMRLDELRQSWQPAHLIHYDLKFENIVIGKELTRQGSHKHCIKLVDWELAGLGDPLWDLGAILGDYLSMWLLSIPVTGNQPPDRFLELARYPLAGIQPAMRHVWHTYTRKAFPGGAPPAHWPARTAAFAAARVLQTAFEHSQMLGGLTGEILCLLQVAINMLERPQEAALHLLGIPPVVSWHVVAQPPAPASTVQ